MKAYLGFVSKFGKVHGSRQESANRYKVFKNNYEMIMRHNVNKHLLPFEMEVNYFTDMTVDEFLDHHKLRVPHHLLADSLDADERIYSRGHHSQVDRFDRADESLPQVKNWYTEGYVTAPYDQHRCGSCWAFTTASTLESLSVISGKFKEPTEFSIQQLVDCDHTNNGCSGGWMYKGYSYVNKFGIMPKDAYPYVGKQGECKFQEDKTLFKNLGMVQEKNLSNEKLKARVAK